MHWLAIRIPVRTGGEEERRIKLYKYTWNWRLEVRVREQSLLRQLTIAKVQKRKRHRYHKRFLRLLCHYTVVTQEKLAPGDQLILGQYILNIRYYLEWRLTMTLSLR